MTKQKIAIFTLLVMTLLFSVAAQSTGDSPGGQLTIITGADRNVVRLRSTRFL